MDITVVFLMTLGLRLQVHVKMASGRKQGLILWFGANHIIYQMYS